MLPEAGIPLQGDGMPLRPQDAPEPSDSALECGIGHRVKASRSVLALALDDDCVFAGLQGGDIVVCRAYFHASGSVADCPIGMVPRDL